MIYAVSDLHGCYEKYRAMLEIINFSDDDTLYVLGDVIDRGAGGVRILQDMMTRQNVVPILGNHEHMALPLLRLLAKRRQPINALYGPDYHAMWMSNGGGKTENTFLALAQAERNEIVAYIDTFSIYAEIQVGNRAFHLSHTLPGFDPDGDIHKVALGDFVWGEPDYDANYKENTLFITGHTPTGLIDPASDGRIWRKNGHIVIDCGAVFGHPLGCLCLDTLEEFYAEG